MQHDSLRFLHCLLNEIPCVPLYGYSSFPKGEGERGIARLVRCCCFACRSLWSGWTRSGRCSFSSCASPCGPFPLRKPEVDQSQRKAYVQFSARHLVEASSTVSDCRSSNAAHFPFFFLLEHTFRCTGGRRSASQLPNSFFPACRASVLGIRVV